MKSQSAWCVPESHIRSLSLESCKQSECMSDNSWLQDDSAPTQPSAKRLKTQPFRVQPVVCAAVKSYKGADGHVYFAASSASDSDPNMHLPCSGDAADKLDEQELETADSCQPRQQSVAAAPADGNAQVTLCQQVVSLRNNATISHRDTLVH